MSRAHRFVITIDHLTEDQMVFFGWSIATADEEFTLYRRDHDGTTQVVQNAPPRYFVCDDLNDAQQMAKGFLLSGPDRYESDF